MKRLSILLLLSLNMLVSGWSQTIFYAASKSGLNLREKDEAGSTVLTKIPYGEKMTFIGMEYKNEAKSEGMSGNWMYVSYGGKKGYVADMYALPVPPPSSPNTLKEYADKIGNVLAEWKNDDVTKNNTEESNQQIEKTLYTNGIVVRSVSGYEWGTTTIWIPDMSIQRAFVLARLLSGDINLLSTSDSFPKQNIKGQDDTQRSIQLYSFFGDLSYPKLIRYEICDGGCYWLEISSEDGDISISFGSAV